MFGSKKFQKGMEAGAKPFEAKFQQYKEAFERVQGNMMVEQNKIMSVAESLLDNVEATQRERLYGLNTQTDIKTLKSECKEILIATLYTLSSKSSNEFQQSYLRSVQKYLEIKNPQTFIEFSAIENIDSQNAQKAIFQSCVEYLLLSNIDSTLFEKYWEQLFNHFVIKDNDMETIWENVLKIYTATGPLGLAEKYGFVTEAETTQESESSFSEEMLDSKMKYSNLYEAYKEGKLPFDQGYIVSSFFSETSFYSIYEVVSYAGLREIFLTAEGLQFVTGGKKLYILVEPPTYNLKQYEPVSRSKSSGEFVPLRFNELDIITAKDQTKIMIAKEPIESFGSFTILEPRGSNFAVLFYQLPDMFASIAAFFKESLNKKRKVPENEAKEASRRIAVTIEKSMGF
jgi:hypothetical protein